MTEMDYPVFPALENSSVPDSDNDRENNFRDVVVGFYRTVFAIFFISSSDIRISTLPHTGQCWTPVPLSFLHTLLQVGQYFIASPVYQTPLAGNGLFLQGDHTPDRYHVVQLRG